jgi:hypothetical protein
MFVVAVEKTLSARRWQVLGEFQLSREPWRVDMVVLRRKSAGEDPVPARMRTVLTGLRNHNLIHLKGSTDTLDASDALQLMAYASGYMLVSGLREVGALALRVVAPSLTDVFTAQLFALGGSLAPTATPGVHEGALGPFPLRVVETSIACDVPHEEILYLFSPRFLDERRPHKPVDEAERQIYNRLYRCIEQLARSPEAAMTRDVELVQKRFEKDLAELIPRMNLAVVLENLTPEQRLAGVTPEQRLAGVTPEQRLAGVTPEQRLAGVPESEQVLALSDTLLRALSPAFLATLPEDIQAKVRARLTR